MSKISKKGKEVRRSPSASTRSSTPKAQKNQDNLNLDDSPISFSCTQEGRDNLDVIWNWHSPSARPRLVAPKNPRNLKATAAANIFLPLRNDKPDLQKVQNDLESLQKEIGISQNDDDSSNDESVLEISLDEDSPAKLSGDFNVFLDDDTIEEEMIIASQVAERVIFCAPPKVSVSVDLPDDSFDMALQKLDDDDIELLSQAVTRTPRVPLRSKSPLKRSPDLFNDTSGEPVVKKPAIYPHIAPVQFPNPKTIQRHPTINGSEISNKQKFKFVPKQFNANVQQQTASDVEKEIERKRLEALAKLESKKQKFTFPQKTHSNCSEPQNSWDSPDVEKEIERKRLEALAKLEAKKLLPSIDTSNPQKQITSHSSENRCETTGAKKPIAPVPSCYQNPRYIPRPPKISPNPPQGATHPPTYPNEQRIPAEIEKEIERKRLEALAKLESKKRSNFRVKSLPNVSVTDSNPPNVSATISNPQSTSVTADINRDNPVTAATNRHSSPQSEDTSPMKCSPEEIEKKRLEARAKLEAKKRFTFLDKTVQIRNGFVPGAAAAAPPESSSPIKCSPEQIEKKRLEALAKLEAKKQLFSGGGILAQSPSKTFGTSLMRHHSTDFARNPPENTRILNSSAKQKSWNEQTDERAERNRLEALRRLQLNKERRRNVP